MAHTTEPRKSHLQQRFCAERREKPFRSKDGLEAMCHALLRRVKGMPAIERVVVDAIQPDDAGNTWDIVELKPAQPPSILVAARAALKEWRGRYDITGD